MINLTPSETKFAALVAAGLSADQICKVTGANRNSLKSIMWRVRKKIGVDSNSHLATVFKTNINNRENRNV